MSEASDSTRSPEQIRAALAGKSVCPFCGALRAAEEKHCARCTLEDSDATRDATKARIGPWYVLQARNPSAPGMKFNTLLALVRRGQVTAQSIVRGPTTHQLWCFAAQVKGLSREFGVCHGCGGAVDALTNLCPYCHRLQEPPINPDSLLETGNGPAERPPARAPLREGGVTADIVMPAIVNSPPVPAPPPPNPSPAQPRPTLTSEVSEALAAPFTPGGSTPQAGVPEDGILSAKELAAAFRLQVNQPMSPRKKRRRGRLVLFLLVLALGAAAAALAWRADWRGQTLDAGRSAWGAITGWFSRIEPEIAPQPIQPPPPRPATRPATQPSPLRTRTPAPPPRSFTPAADN